MSTMGTINGRKHHSAGCRIFSTRIKGRIAIAAFGLFSVASLNAVAKDISMTNQPLVIKATCQGTHACAYEGKDLWLKIHITNTGTTTVGFPLAYRQKTGPSIRLVNTRANVETYVPTNLADPKLREELTMIVPGASVVLDWVIKPGDLQQFGEGPADDVSAEITLQAQIQTEGKFVEFIGTDTLRIIRKNKS